MKRPAATPAAPRPPITAAALRELAAEGPLAVSVRGGCMEPAFPQGARIEVLRRRLVWPGDPVLFVAADGRLTLHRAIGWRPTRRGGWQLVTRADGARHPDVPVAAGAVVGRAVGPPSLAGVRVGAAVRLRAWLAWACLAAGSLRRRARRGGAA